MFAKDDPDVIKLRCTLDDLLASESKICPRVKLIIAIIRSGVLEFDIDYFKSNLFEAHMDIIGMSARTWREKFGCLGR